MSTRETSVPIPAVTEATPILDARPPPDDGTGDARRPFFRRLSFRLAVLLFLGFFVVDIISVPVWDWLITESSQELYDPEALRAYADQLENDPENAQDPLVISDYDDYLYVYGGTIVYNLLMSLLLAFAISVLATRRIKRLAREAAQPLNSVSDLPGPFTAKGDDEIAQLADNMNRMRGRTARLLAKLNERDRLRIDWVGDVSHDLRTPLTALAVSVERCTTLLDDIPDSPQREDMQRMLSAAQLDTRRVLDLAEDLLEIARLEAGQALMTEPVPPGQLLREAVEGLLPIAEDRGIALTLDYSPGLPELNADGRRLIRAIVNLIINSLQHAASQVHVSACACEESNTLEIVVEDDGHGLPETDGKVVLSRLGRDAGRRDSTGIGLEVAQRIIDAHLGTMSGHNKSDGGASVSIRLPACEGHDDEDGLEAE